ncbi:MAG: hypothetical protein ACRCXT_21955 [Paraclostridium sp.]
MGWFSEFLQPITDIIKVPLEGYENRKTLKVEAELKQLDRDHEINMKKLDTASKLAEQGIQIEANWDTNAQNDAKVSWKDEYLTILLTVPLVLAFIPYTQQAVLNGFNTLQQTPIWYLTLVSGVVASAFGLRWLISRSK